MRAAVGLYVLLPALLACALVRDTRPLQDRLAAVSQAFVGRVESVQDGVATFTVELPLRGAPARQMRVPIGSDRRGIQLRAGDRWFFAGPRSTDPSRPLGPASAPLAQAVARLDDTRLGIEAWQRCDDSSQCVPIDNGCLPTAAHRDHREAAARQALARGGDPRAMSCEVPPWADILLACVDRRCGAWRLRPAP